MAAGCYHQAIGRKIILRLGDTATAISRLDCIRNQQSSNTIDRRLVRAWLSAALHIKSSIRCGRAYRQPNSQPDVAEDRAVWVKTQLKKFVDAYNQDDGHRQFSHQVTPVGCDAWSAVGGFAGGNASVPFFMSGHTSS